MNQNKLINRITVLLLVCSFLLSTSVVSAHVVVRPNSVGIGAFQTFAVAVPVEKDLPTTGVRLVIPEGLAHVTPNVKPGWTITTIKTGEGEHATITEIVWSGGTIPVGQRDEFAFSAKVPSTETELLWKAYQTSADNSIVSWDADPTALHDAEDDSIQAGPYSVTKVIDDLTAVADTKVIPASQNDASLTLSILAIFVSLVAIVLQVQKRKK